MVPRSKKYNAFAYDNKKHVFKGTNTAVCVKKGFNIKYVLGILNSSLCTYWYNVEGTDYHGNSRKYEPNNVKNLIIPKFNDKIQQIIEEQVSIILSKQYCKDKLAREFTNWLKVKTKIDICDFKFFNYNFQYLIDNFKIRNIPPRELNEIKFYFDKYLFKYNELCSEKNIADKKIDEIIYKMYGINILQISKIEDYLKCL